jgi:hypothetical protein
MRVTVQLTKEATKKVRSQGSSGAKRSVLPWLDAPLNPVHTKIADPALASFFEIEIDDPAEAKRLVQRLLADHAVDAAYIKPDDELPM